MLLLLKPVSSQCPAGLYSSDGGCLPCSAGSFCAGGAQASCSRCGGGVNYQTRACSLTRDAVCVSCTQCAAGYYAKRPCNATADTVCAPCSAGAFYCLGGAAPVAACSPCVVGGGVSLIKACSSKADTVCFVCPSGYLCTRPPAMTVCPAGFSCTGGSYAACDRLGDYCPAGSSATRSCPAGSYCVDSTDAQPCAAGFYCPSRTYDFTMFPCTRGSVCVQGSAAPAPCVLGNFCPDATTQSPCPRKYFCPAGVADYSQYACALGSYCGGGASAETSCAAGYYCADPGSMVRCPAGSSCPRGSVEPKPCSPGSTCLAGAGAELDCPGGYFCLTPSTAPVQCPSGYVCPAKSVAVGPACADGTRCPAGSAVPQLCSAGFVCAGNRYEACVPGDMCPQGTADPVRCGTDGSSVCKTNTSWLCPPGSVDVRRGVGYVMFNSFNSPGSGFTYQTLYAVSLTDGSAVTYALSRSLYADGTRQCIDPRNCRYASPLLVSFDRTSLVAFTRQLTWGGVWVSHAWAIDMRTRENTKPVQLIGQLLTDAGAEIEVQAAMFWGNGSRLLVVGGAGAWLVGGGLPAAMVCGNGFGNVVGMFQTDDAELVVVGAWSQLVLINVTSGAVIPRYSFSGMMSSMDIAPDRLTLYLWVMPKLYRMNALSGPLTQIATMFGSSFYGTEHVRYLSDTGVVQLLARHVYEGGVSLDVFDAKTGARTGPFGVGANIPWSYTYSVSSSVASECRRCLDVPNGFWSDADNCKRFGCNEGFWKNGTIRCVACTQGIVCNRSQYYVPCAVGADAYCARCAPVKNMANWTDALCNFTCANGFYRSGYTCVRCSNATCRNGMFREQCDGGRWARDAKCVSCVPPGRVGTYRWGAGGCGMFNCSNGHDRSNLRCVQIRANVTQLGY